MEIYQNCLYQLAEKPCIYLPVAALDCTFFRWLCRSELMQYWSLFYEGIL